MSVSHIYKEIRSENNQFLLGPSAVARTDLRSCHLGNCTFGKLPLGKNPM